MSTTHTSTAGGPAAPRSPATSTTHISLQLKRFCGSCDENPEAFLRHLRYAKGASSWTDVQALYYAGLHLDGKAGIWFSNQEFPTLDAFERALLERFGLDPSKMISALSRRVQGEEESVRDFADSLRTLARWSSNSNVEGMMLHFFLEGLKDDVRAFVLTRRPGSFEQAVSEGEFYEDNFTNRTAVLPSVDSSFEVSHGRALKPANRSTYDATTKVTAAVDPIQELAKEMGELRLQLAEFQHTLRRDAGPAANLVCHNCGQPGHRWRDCTAPFRRPVAGAPINYMEKPAFEAYYCCSPELNMQEKHSHYGAPARSTPATRQFRSAPFGSKNLSSVSQPSVQAVTPAAGGSQRVSSLAASAHAPPTAVQLPGVVPLAAKVRRSAAPVPTAKLDAAPKFPTSCMKPGYNVVSQLEKTPALVSVTEALRASPAYRAQVKAFLDEIEASHGSNQVSFEPAPKVQFYSKAKEASKLDSVKSDACFATDGTRMKRFSSFVNKPAHCHDLTSVVRVHCRVFGLPVVAIVDSGASHSVLSQRVARKLQLLDRLEETSSTFVTASGAQEKPWGLLTGVPVTVGKLTLDMDMPVVGATTYDLLLGNDWLIQSCCHMSWDARKMRLLVTPGEYDEIDFDVEGQLRAPCTFNLEPRSRPTVGIGILPRSAEQSPTASSGGSPGHPAYMMELDGGRLTPTPPKGSKVSERQFNRTSGDAPEMPSSRLWPSIYSSVCSGSRRPLPSCQRMPLQPRALLWLIAVLLIVPATVASVPGAVPSAFVSLPIVVCNGSHTTSDTEPMAIARDSPGTVLHICVPWLPRLDVRKPSPSTQAPAPAFTEGHYTCDENDPMNFSRRSAFGELHTVYVLIRCPVDVVVRMVLMLVDKTTAGDPTKPLPATKLDDCYTAMGVKPVRAHKNE